MKKLVPLLFLVFCASTYAQNELNNYKYIIVPKQFDAFKTQNQYQTSTLVKFLLVENGFNVVYDDALPPELSNNRCMGLNATLNDVSNMFSTKVSIVLKDCNSKEVFTSIEGFSKIKEYREAYNEAIKKAAISFKGYAYKYNAPKTSKPMPLSLDTKKEAAFEKDEEEVRVLKERMAQRKAEETTTVSFANDVQSVNVAKPVTQNDIYYAQEIANGYQLVDKTPKITMKIQKTSQPNIYLGKEVEGHSGLVYIKNGKWFFEFYDADELKVKSLNIKF
ncbi:hypothetical protein KO500_11560 [Cellulophaga baltica]|uniref:hypothetical protein n=1 Tax=Cellulophaga TaxID=104264 RepID=UPI001C078341|nr:MULTISPECIES: hypothetical protein [Cellulophaga]MBU2997076.1 hypothetical protein [Cellulophaga baltica]MDO6768474.1 hypothetical protein [Cellulophaga sp. 1_MG-2023]